MLYLYIKRAWCCLVWIQASNSKHPTAMKIAAFQLVLLFGIAAAANQRAANMEDNDFAEFEDMEDGKYGILDSVFNP